MPEAIAETREEKEAVLRRKMLGVKVRHARMRSGLSLKEAGEALGVSSGLVSDIEFGRRDVSLPQQNRKPRREICFRSLPEPKRQSINYWNIYKKY